MISGKISCVLTDCKAGFDIEANFVKHLRNEHDIDKNIHRWVNIAKKKAGVFSEPVLEITLDDDDEEEEEKKKVQIANNNVQVDGDGDRNKPGGQKIDFAVISENVSRNIFANCRQLLDDPQGQKMADNYKVDKALTSEEYISDFFEKFKKKVQNTQIPAELVERLKDSDEKSSNEEKMSRGPSEKYSSNFDLQSQVAERKQYERRLRCPVSGCEFTTDKAGMRRGEAAKHLIESHEVTTRDMTPGKFIFIKIKVEKST